MPPADATPADATPARDRLQDATVEQTFPASDPGAGTPAPAARAVDPAELRAAHAPAPADATTISRRFADPEAAKLALETIVREGPFDRRHAAIVEAGGGAELRLQAVPTDAERLRGLIER